MEHMSLKKFHLSKLEQQTGLLVRLQLLSVNDTIFAYAIIGTAEYSISSFFPLFFNGITV